MASTVEMFGVRLPKDLVRRVMEYINRKNKPYGYRKYTQGDFTEEAFMLFLEAESLKYKEDEGKP